MRLPSHYISAALVGVFSHVAYFKSGEHHLHGVFYLKLLFITITTGTAVLSHLKGTVWTGFMTAISLTGAYLLGLYGSLLVYRIFLHPLRKVPGPFGARLSTAWIATQLENNNQHTKLLELHRQYGPFVRIGSSDISVIHPKALDIVYGPNSRCFKGISYDMSYPEVSLQLMRNPAQHHARRRVWSGAFSDKLLRGYEQRIRGYREKLVARLSEMSMSGQPVNIRKWFSLYSFDVMGDLSFGEGFGSLERGEEHWAIQLLNAFVDPIGLFLPTWAFVLLAATPGLSGDFWKFPAFCKEKMVARFTNNPEIPDISSSLISPLKGRSLSELSLDEQNLLYSDARVIVIAGSDTTSGALSAIFYELVRHPEEIEKLRAELEPFANGATREFLHSTIAQLDHLNGIINEALRLYPAVPSALQRQTPPEGVIIDGVHVPGETHIFCPLYCIGRSELAYARPEEFIPERWYKWPELVKEKAAFMPFSAGEFNCIGRPLALMNLRTTVARLVMEFDIEFAPGEDGSRFLGDAKDNFVFYFGHLNLVFTRR
ncbi:cytochrome P450 [Aspergillus lucknowensis]|uniref:Cytochrome P450 n=1 Tax=Aspergillus lucknowensis TaxID=176173 RepID=A0ABR4LUF2_9EURO